MSPMIGTLEDWEVFCLEEACSLEGVEKKVSCSPVCLLEPRLAAFIVFSISRKPESLAIGGWVDGVLEGSDEVALRRLLLCRSDISYS